MRIAILNRNNRIVGGAEQYLAASVGPLSAAGHEISLWYEETPGGQREQRALIDCPTRHVPWSGQSGREELLDQLARYNADIVCVHSPLDFGIEDAVLATYPAIWFAHDYSLTCISGGKTLHAHPDRPCTRALGPGCLLHYYPHRCGGLNPVTMMRNYLLNERRRDHLHRYSAVVTFSNHMAMEYIGHGLPPERVHVVPPFVTRLVKSPVSTFDEVNSHAERSPGAPVVRPPVPERSRVGFVGRFETQKGVELLVRALPLAAAGLGRSLTLKLVGAGSQRKQLETLGDAITRESNLVSIQFGEWTKGADLNAFYYGLDLLVVPSIWPEPFGLVGLEASQRSIPVAAFAVGGIPDWLRDGVNGHLAPGDPPTADGLAVAITKCLRDPAHHAALREAGPRVVDSFSTEQHVDGIISLLRQAVSGSNKAQPAG